MIYSGAINKCVGRFCPHIFTKCAINLNLVPGTGIFFFFVHVYTVPTYVRNMFFLNCCCYLLLWLCFFVRMIYLVFRCLIFSFSFSFHAFFMFFCVRYFISLSSSVSAGLLACVVVVLVVSSTTIAWHCIASMQRTHSISVCWECCDHKA